MDRPKVSSENCFTRVCRDFGGKGGGGGETEPPVESPVQDLERCLGGSSGAAVAGCCCSRDKRCWTPLSWERENLNWRPPLPSWCLDRRPASSSVVVPLRRLSRLTERVPSAVLLLLLRMRNVFLPRIRSQERSRTSASWFCLSILPWMRKNNICKYRAIIVTFWMIIPSRNFFLLHNKFSQIIEIFRL